MNRFEQRLQKRLQNEEFAEGYREMDAELELMHAIDLIRKQQHISQEKLATLMEGNEKRYRACSLQTMLILR